MFTKLRNFCIRLLFRLIDIPGDKEIDDKHVEEWLAMSWQHPGFRKYMSIRTGKFLKHLSGGVGMKELPRDDYVRNIGQRFELLRFGNDAQKAYERKKPQE